jgi:hypothetical protein
VRSQGIPRAVVRRYGRVDGFGREFRKKGSDLSGLIAIAPDELEDDSLDLVTLA